MKNQSVSDFVAASMNAVLNSKEHKSLFDVQYKYAQDMNSATDSMCAEHGKMDSCEADDNEARKAKKDDEDKSSADDSFAWDDNDARKKKDSDEDSSSADDDDDDNDARKAKKDDEDSASDGLEPSAAFDVAIDSLLTASAALDSVGLGRGSALVLKIASLTVEAKKKEKDSKKDSKKSKDSQSAKDKKSKDSKDSKKSSKDSQSAKDKKSDSKSSKDSKDSKKSSKPAFLSKKK